MNRISVANYIANGFSQSDADTLAPVVKTALIDKEPVVLDFNGVQFFTTLFFSTALTYLVNEYGEEEYNRLIVIENLSESGCETYKHALDYAIQYYKKTPDEQEEERAIINEETEDH